MQRQVASVSLIGRRSANQDRIRWQQCGDRLLLCLGDGLGGHAAGDRAAQCLVDTVAEFFKRPIAHPEQFHQNTLTLAHRRILALAADYPDQPPPATTAVVCVIDGAWACWAHVGDSRLYHISDTSMERTRDHGPVELLIQNGSISATEARIHPLRNRIDRTVGGFTEAPLPVIHPPVTLHRGDVLLLCSDGFWSAFDDEELTDAMRQIPDGEQAMNATLENMAAAAVARNGQHADNASALVMRYEEPVNN